MAETGDIKRQAKNLQSHWVEHWRVYDADEVDILLDNLMFAETNGRSVLARLGGCLKEHDPSIQVGIGSAIIELHEYPDSEDPDWINVEAVIYKVDTSGETKVDPSDVR